MPTVDLKNMEGQTVGEVELSDALFASEVNPFAVHLVVRAILNGRRVGTQADLVAQRQCARGHLEQQPGMADGRRLGRRKLLLQQRYDAGAWR